MRLCQLLSGHPCADPFFGCVRFTGSAQPKWKEEKNGKSTAGPGEEVAWIGARGFHFRRVLQSGERRADEQRLYLGCWQQAPFVFPMSLLTELHSTPTRPVVWFLEPDVDYPR